MELGWALPWLILCSSCFSCIPGDQSDPHFAIEIQWFVFPCVPLQKLQNWQHSSECVNTSPLAREVPIHGEKYLAMKFQVMLGGSMLSGCPREANFSISLFPSLPLQLSQQTLASPSPSGVRKTPCKNELSQEPSLVVLKSSLIYPRREGVSFDDSEHLPRISSSLCFLNKIPVLVATLPIPWGLTDCGHGQRIPEWFGKGP